MGGGGGGSQTYTKGYRYYMSILMGLGVGPIDEVTSISIGDKKAWTGSLADINTINIDKGNLFGGESGEGGIVGTVWAFFGAKAQVIPQSIKSIMGSNAPAPSQFGPFSDWLNEFNIPLQQIGFWEARRQYEAYVAQQQALSASAVPDFRGVATLFFDGMVCAINPYPKTWKVRRNRRQAGWDGAVWQPSLANIDMVATVSIEDTDDNGNGLGTYSDVTDTIKAMNPAHIIYQALTDRNFGRGYPRAMLDEIGFLACAQQLKAEGFGLCYDWDAKNTSIADFIGAIVNTIGAALRVDRVSGLITLKLIRDDYVA